MGPHGLQPRPDHGDALAVPLTWWAASLLCSLHIAATKQASHEHDAPTFTQGFCSRQIQRPAHGPVGGSRFANHGTCCSAPAGRSTVIRHGFTAYRRARSFTSRPVLHDKRQYYSALASRPAASTSTPSPPTQGARTVQQAGESTSPRYLPCMSVKKADARSRSQDDPRSSKRCLVLARALCPVLPPCQGLHRRRSSIHSPATYFHIRTCVQLA